MRAMVLEAPRGRLVPRERAAPVPAAGEVLLRVAACGVCRTDLHVVDGELADAALPLVPGHEIVGRVVAAGAGVATLHPGDRVGVPWLAWACGTCRACRDGRENLCETARFTGYTCDGGYATHAIADARFVLPLPAGYDDVHAAPLLCAGLIGYRAYAMAGHAPVLGIYGFGAAAHLVAQLAVHEGRRVLAFTRPGDAAAQALARSLGAAWAGGSDEPPPEPLDAALIFAPVGALVPVALAATRPGGGVVCAGIHMSDVPSFPYRLLWQERSLRSVANLTRADGERFLAAAARFPLDVHVTPYPLARANEALDDLRAGRVAGAAVLTMPHD
ncbi:MAG TPA: zinc-dependent alcohol dehydrogenase family protein [Casimicrobiaceae bacterium]|nr:zinc-dependent alcohol dehydrogenase family protein [Casimicrobiaceae bacterium]